MKLTKKEILAWFRMVRQQSVRDNYVEILLNIEQEMNILSPEERIRYDIQTTIETDADKKYTVLLINYTKWQYAIKLYFFKGECFKIAGY